MVNEIIASAASIDDLLKAIGHEEDCRRDMSVDIRIDSRTKKW